MMINAPTMNDLDRIMVNQIVIMNALRVAASDEAVKKDLATCIHQTINHNPRVRPAIHKVWNDAKEPAA